MPCYHPLTAYKLSKLIGVRSATTFRPLDLPKVVFSVPKGCSPVYKEIQLPCGQCVGCRLDRSRQWAIRCVHEASLHNDNCFVTLTLNDEFLPPSRSLDKSVFVRFMKRLRNRFGSGIRFYMCGEYGETFKRPHYHVLLFGFDFPDKVLFSPNRGNPLYVSDALNQLWSCPRTGRSFGYATIGNVTFESAAYVARYIMKKITGSQSSDFYTWSDPVTGEVFTRIPEYNNMSRMPGIGKGYFDKFVGDMYPRDFVVVNGKKVKPPKYYDRQYEILTTKEIVLGSGLIFKEKSVNFNNMLTRRQIKAKLYLDDNTPDRLSVKERVALARLKQLKRGIDNDL